jgi:hypothetical protein
MFGETERTAAPTPMAWPSTTVLASGIATSAATLFGLYLLSQRWPEFQPMGFYVNLVLPVGALLVGLIAGSGYGIASWLTGSKIGKVTLLAVVLLQVWAYFMAQNLEFRTLVENQKNILADLKMTDDDGNEVAVPQELIDELTPSSFWEYFDATTRSFAFNDRQGNPGPALGTWGYLVRLAEVVGFALGGLIAPAILMACPYCESCSVYMKSKQLGVLPAGIEPRKIKKADADGTAAYEQEIGTALAEGQALAAATLDAGEAGDAAAVADLLAEHGPAKKAINKATARTELHLRRCPRCNGGALVAKIVSGYGEKVQVLAEEKRDVGPDFVRGLQERQVV